jgi:cellulose synthase/poly-beta-1,6-N-acetylglucosamine synthase-like glycosyltransferase
MIRFSVFNIIFREQVDSYAYQFHHSFVLLYLHMIANKSTHMLTNSIIHSFCSIVSSSQNSHKIVGVPYVRIMGLLSCIQLTQNNASSHGSSHGSSHILTQNRGSTICTHNGLAHLYIPSFLTHVIPREYISDEKNQVEVFMEFTHTHTKSWEYHMYA